MERKEDNMKEDNMKVMKYSDVRNQIQTGDMLETAGSSFVGKAIRFFTKQEVNHTELILGLDNYISEDMVYGTDRKFVLQADSPGIVLNTLSDQFKGNILYWSKLKSEFEPCRKRMGVYGLFQVGKKYDYGTLFKNILGKVNADASKFICSEFYFFALVAGGCLPQYKINNQCNIVDKDNTPVKTPVPGTFKQFGIHEEPIQIIL